MIYNDCLTKLIEAGEYIERCIKSCKTPDQFSTTSKMITNLCSMCDMWWDRLGNRKERKKFDSSSKSVIDGLIKLGENWISQYQEFQKNEEESAPTIVGFSEIFYKD